MADPYIANVSLLLHCDGADGSTVFTDNSPRPKTVTVSGTARISNTQAKWGGTSAKFDGSGFLTLDGSSDFVFGTGDFTIEFWLYNLDTTGNRWFIDFEPNDGSHAAGKINILNYGATTPWVQIAETTVLTGGAVITTGSWQHIALTRAGTNLKLFVDGTQTGSTVTNSTNLDVGANRPILGTIGWGENSGFTGYLDDIRITKGVARYTANFTPPIAAFADSWSPPEVFKNINTVLSKSAFQWISLPKKYKAIPAKYTALHNYKNAIYGGTGVISGTVKIGTTAAKRRVRLYENSTGILIREIWANIDGTYSFTGLNKGYIYTVTTTDIGNVYNDIIYSNITAT